MPEDTLSERITAEQHDLLVNSAWSDVEMLKNACYMYALKAGFEFSTLYSDKRRYTIICKSKSQGQDCS